jgi:hypothetical protein
MEVVVSEDRQATALPPGVEQPNPCLARQDAADGTKAAPREELFHRRQAGRADRHEKAVIFPSMQGEAERILLPGKRHDRWIQGQGRKLHARAHSAGPAEAGKIP